MALGTWLWALVQELLLCGTVCCWCQARCSAHTSLRLVHSKLQSPQGRLGCAVDGGPRAGRARHGSGPGHPRHGAAAAEAAGAWLSSAADALIACVELRISPSRLKFSPGLALQYGSADSCCPGHPVRAAVMAPVLIAAGGQAAGLHAGARDGGAAGGAGLPAAPVGGRAPKRPAAAWCSSSQFLLFPTSLHHTCTSAVHEMALSGRVDVPRDAVSQRPWSVCVVNVTSSQRSYFDRL